MLKGLSKDIAVYGLGNFIVKFIAFAVFPVYANIFTVEEFGVMTLIVTLTALVAIFIEGGVLNAIVRFYWDYDEAKRKHLLSTIIWILIAWSIVFSGVLLLVLYPYRNIIADRYGILWIFLLLSLLSNIPKQILLFSLTLFRIRFLKWKFILVLILDNLFGVALGLLLIIVFKKGLAGYFWGIFLGSSAALPLVIWLIKDSFQLQFKSSIAKTIFIYSYPFIFSNLAYWLFGSMDRWMLSELSNNTQVGFYSIAFKIAMVVGFLGTAFSLTWSAASMKIYTDDPNHKNIFSKVLTNWFLFTTMIGMILSFFGFEILHVLTPAPYWPAASILSIVIMGAVINSVQSIAATGIFIAKKTHYIAYASWAAAIVNLSLNFYLIPKMGALGAAISTMISYAILNGLYLYWSQQTYPIPIEKKKLLFPLFIIAVVLIYTFYIDELEWNFWIFAIKIIVCLLFILLTFMLKVIDFNYLKVNFVNFFKKQL